MAKTTRKGPGNPRIMPECHHQVRIYDEVYDGAVKARGERLEWQKASITKIVNDLIRIGLLSDL